MGEVAVDVAIRKPRRSRCATRSKPTWNQVSEPGSNLWPQRRSPVLLLELRQLVVAYITHLRHNSVVNDCALDANVPFFRVWVTEILWYLGLISESRIYPWDQRIQERNSLRAEEASRGHAGAGL